MNGRNLPKRKVTRLQANRPKHAGLENTNSA
jgi:hypothetical protein